MKRFLAYTWTAVVVALAIATAVGAFGCDGGSYVDFDALEPQSCDYVFSPEPALEAETVDAAMAWSFATGLRICFAPGGTPVVEQTPLLNRDGERYCGGTFTNFSGNRFAGVTKIGIDHTLAGCGGPMHTILHEMGHALSRGRKNDPSHAPRGMMSPGANDDDTIDADAIDYVCLRAPCR